MIKEKIKKLSELKKIIAHLKKQGKKIVFTNGCFDLLHFGHAKYLEDAKNKGDILVVAVNTDASVRKLKGKNRPIIKEKDRLGLVASFESVDYVVLFNEATPFKIIKELKPDILVKGSDWKKTDIVGSDIVLSNAGRVYSIKFLKGRSSTNLIKKIAKICSTKRHQ